MIDDLDLRVRMAAFQFLEEQVRSSGEVLPLTVLRRGFDFDGGRVPLMNAIQGIFKPAVLDEMPLSITTTPVEDDAARPYDDLMTTAGLLYRYRGTDPQQPDNVGLRRAMQRQRPLIYFHGIVAGQYFPEWPVYVVGDAPGRLTFTVNIDDRRLAGMQPRDDDEDAPGRRRYVTREVQVPVASAGVPSEGRRGLPTPLRGLQTEAPGAAGGGTHPARWPSARRADRAERYRSVLAPSSRVRRAHSGRHTGLHHRGQARRPGGDRRTDADSRHSRLPWPADPIAHAARRLASA